MAVPKKRRSKSKQRMKHAQWKVTAPNLRACPQCSEMALAHHVCPSCGYYNGKQIIQIKEKEPQKDA